MLPCAEVSAPRAIEVGQAPEEAPEPGLPVPDGGKGTEIGAPPAVGTKQIRALKLKIGSA